MAKNTNETNEAFFDGTMDAVEEIDIDSIVQAKSTIPTTGKRKIIRRKPGDTSPRKYYFDEKTQDAIVRFQKESIQKLKEEIYAKEIDPAFKALVENLINVYKFQVAHDSKEDLRNEGVQFLYTIINKFDATRGSRAFAYFNVVAKHWLTIKSKQNVKIIQNFVSLDNNAPEAFTKHDLEILENYTTELSPVDVLTQEEKKENIKKILAKLRSGAKTKNEIETLNAIDTLFESVETVDLVSKRAVLAYMRELTKFSPKQLSSTLSGLKKEYKNARSSGEFDL